MTLEHSGDPAPPLTAAPRHLRRRRLHAEIPDTLLVPGAGYFVPPEAQAVRPVRDRAGSGPAKSGDDPEVRRKRAVALAVVLAVAFAVPALILALIFLN